MGPRVNPQRCLVKAVGICIGSSPTVPSVIFGLDPEIHVPAVMAGSNLIAMGPRVKPEDDEFSPVDNASILDRAIKLRYDKWGTMTPGPNAQFN